MALAVLSPAAAWAQLPSRVVDIPVLVVHHREDGCALRALSAVDGGANQGEPCEAFAYHGDNGLEREVVAKIAAWITAR